MVTILDRLAQHAAATPDRVIYTWLGECNTAPEQVTFANLDCRARTLAARLGRQARPGDRALLLYPNGLEFVAAFLGCLYAGVVAVPAYPPRRHRSSKRLVHIADDCQPKVILTTSAILDGLDMNLFGARHSTACIATDRIATDPAAPSWAGNHLAPGGLAFLQYTSGSTGRPNGVMVSHENLAWNERCIQQSFCQTAESVVVSWLPMFHDMGLIGDVLQPLFVGCHAVLMSPLAFVAKPVRWLHAISHYQATTSGGPNFGYEHALKLIKQQEKEQLDLSSWRVAYNGSEPVRAGTLTRFSDAFRACGFRPQAFFPCYGLAEATLFVSGGPVDREPRVMNLCSRAAPQATAIDAPLSEQDRPVVSCGQLAADLDVVIVDPERRVPLEAGMIGEIWLRGRSITNGYWNNGSATRESFQMRLADSSSGPVFFRSGDLGFLDGDELFVTGRIKDLIIVRGRNIYPQDVEHLIAESLPFGQQNSVAAFTVDKGTSEALGVVIEADRSLVRLARAYGGSEPGQPRPADRLVDLDRRLAEFSTLLNDIRDAVSHEFDVSVACFAFLPPGAFPRTSSGKVQRSLCRAGLMSRTMPLLNLPECVTQASHSMNPSSP